MEITPYSLCQEGIFKLKGWIFVRFLTTYGIILSLREVIIRAPQGATSQLHLPERTRTFIQRAFADGTVERIDNVAKSDKARVKKWERGKWLIVRYLTDE